MPRVKFSHPAIVRDRKYTPGQEADLDDAAAKDVMAQGVGSIVGASEVRTAVDPSQAAARKSVRLEP